MKAKLVHLTDRQFRELTAEAQELGVPLSELIRRILDVHIRSTSYSLDEPVRVQRPAGWEKSRGR